VRTDVKQNTSGAVVLPRDQKRLSRNIDGLKIIGLWNFGGQSDKNRHAVEYEVDFFLPDGWVGIGFGRHLHYCFGLIRGFVSDKREHLRNNMIVFGLVIHGIFP
jgi:hypothetical protein